MNVQYQWNVIMARRKKYQKLLGSKPLEIKRGLRGERKAKKSFSTKAPTYRRTKNGKKASISTYRGLTTWNDDHRHTYTINSNGDGVTTMEDGHYHTIVNYEVVEICEDSGDISNMCHMHYINDVREQRNDMFNSNTRTQVRTVRQEKRTGNRKDMNRRFYPNTTKNNNGGNRNGNY